MKRQFYYFSLYLKPPHHSFSPTFSITTYRFRHRWEDNVRSDLRKIGWVGVGWKHLAQDMAQWWGLVNMVMNL
jgi:hypothetical protein